MIVAVSGSAPDDETVAYLVRLTSSIPGADIFLAAPEATDAGQWQHVVAGPDPADLLDAFADFAAEWPASLTLASAGEQDLDGVLATLDSWRAPVVLVSSDGTGRLRVVNHTVTAAGSSVHEVADPTHRSAGVLRLARVDLPAAAAAWRDLAEVVRGQRWQAADALDLALLALVRRGIAVRALEAGSRATAPGPYTVHAVRRVVRPLAASARRWRISRTSATVTSFATAVATGLLAAAGTTLSLVLAAVFLQLWVLFVALRHELGESDPATAAREEWASRVLRRLEELIVIAGVAVGAEGVERDLWLAAAVLALLLTYLGVSSAAIRAVRRSRADARPVLLPLDEPHDARRPQPAAHVGPLPEGRGGWVAGLFSGPTPELLLVTSVVLAVAGARAALLTVLAWAVLAILVTTSVGLLTAMWPLPIGRWLTTTRAARLLELCDPGPMAALVGREDPQLSLLRRLSALRVGLFVPGLSWAIEAAVLVALAAQADKNLLPLAFVLLALVSLHRYDTIYRRETSGSVAAGWVFVIGLGALGRSVAYVVLASLGWLAQGLVGLTLVWAALFAAEAASYWSAGSARPTD